jgi:hypothetical protein
MHASRIFRSIRHVHKQGLAIKTLIAFLIKFWPSANFYFFFTDGELSNHVLPPSSVASLWFSPHFAVLILSLLHTLSAWSCTQVLGNLRGSGAEELDQKGETCCERACDETHSEVRRMRYNNANLSK